MMVTIKIGTEILFAEPVRGGYVIRDLRRAGEFVANDEVEVI